MNNKSTRIQGEGTQTLAAGASVTIDPHVSLSGISSPRGDALAQFVVSNENAAGTGKNLYICGTDGLEALPIFPQTVVTLETDAPFKIKNTSDTTITYTVGRLLIRGAGGGGSAPGSPASGSSSGSFDSGGGGVGDTNNRFHFKGVR